MVIIIFKKTPQKSPYFTDISSLNVFFRSCFHSINSLQCIFLPPGIFLYFCALSLRSDHIVSSKKPQDINLPYVSCSSVVVFKDLIAQSNYF